MAKGVDYQRLSVDGTLNAGLSILGVTFIIGILVGLFVIAAFTFQENSTVYICANGEILEDERVVEDGTADCLDGSDEFWPNPENNGEIVESSQFGFISYMMLGCSGIFLVAGILGLSTKILADSISAGLALHAADQNPRGNIKSIVPIMPATPIQVSTPVPAPIPAPVPAPMHSQQQHIPEPGSGHSMPPPQ